MMARPATALIGVLLIGILAAPAAAGGHRHRRCGACGCTRVKKVCRLVCETRDEISYEYDVDCDEYCLLGKSDILGKRWVADCKSPLGRRKKILWQPHCSCKIRTRKTLVKIPVIKKVPWYTCVVENVCGKCGKAEADPQATAQAREQGIMPASAKEPIVLDDDSGDDDSGDDDSGDDDAGHVEAANDQA